MFAFFFKTIFAKIEACFFSMLKKMKLRNKHKNVNDLQQTFSFIVWKRMKPKSSNGKYGQKELLVFHSQLKYMQLFNTQLKLNKIGAT